MEITTHLVSLREECQALNDITTYRKRLSHRAVAIRKRLGLAKPSKVRSGDGKATSKDQAFNQPDYARLLLLSAEKGWASAMEIKQMAASKKNVSGASRAQITSRLSKAVKHAETLLHLQSGEESSTAQLEITAYRALLMGTLFFERGDWVKSTKSLAESWILHQALARSSDKALYREFNTSNIEPSLRIAGYHSTQSRSTAIDKVARQAFPREDLQTVAILDRLAPGILEEAKATSDQSGLQRTADLRTCITWRSRTVSLEDAAIAQSMVSADEASRDLLNSFSDSAFAYLPPPIKAARYDPLLIASQDVIDTVNHSISDLTSTGVLSSDPKIQNLQVIRTATTYDLVSWRVGRNRALVGPKDGMDMSTLGGLPQKRKRAQTTTRAKREQKLGSKSDEVDQSKTDHLDGSIHPSLSDQGGRNLQLKRLREKVALYDASLQSIESVTSLPGVAADEELQKNLSAKETYFRALRLLSLAKSRALLTQLSESVALVSAAKTMLSRETASKFRITHDPTPPQSGLDITSTDLELLQKIVQQTLLHVRSLKELEKIETAQQKQAEGRLYPPLVDRLKSYPVGNAIDTKNLVTYPPRVLPVPVKPIFLDVAWNYIDYPGAVSEAPIRPSAVAAESMEEQAAQTKKKGWFGFSR